MAAVRRVYPNAYARWTERDDERLRARYHAGATLDELGREFGRKPTAVEVRLEMLGGLVRGAGPDAGGGTAGPGR